MTKDIVNEEPRNTKEVLIEAGMRLFAKYGYMGASTRMIANEVGMNMNAIQFHFGGKENLYKNVLDHVAKACEDVYAPINKEIEDARKAAPITRAQAVGFVKKIIEIQIDNALGNINPDHLALMYWEQLDPAPDAYMPISRLTLEKCEEALSSLFQSLSTDIPEETAIILSRFINGGIISFGEHPTFLSNIQAKSPKADYRVKIRDVLLNFVMEALESFFMPG